MAMKTDKEAAKAAFERLLGIMERHLDGARDYELVIDDEAGVA